MNEVNQTLFISLYGKAYVSKKNIILKDKRAEEIWAQVEFPLKGKSKSKWLAYYMAMRARIYDEWLKERLKENPKAIVLYVGCGLDSRWERVSVKASQWYDIDFPEVIEERRNYYQESDSYHMLSADMRTDEWKKRIKSDGDAIIVMEGVSMYFQPEKLKKLLADFAEHFSSVKILMDCYTQRAAKASKYKNPINDVGVTLVYGYDEPKELAAQSGLKFFKEYDMTPQKYIDELQGMEKTIFQRLYAGSIAKSLYRMFEFERLTRTKIILD